MNNDVNPYASPQQTDEQPKSWRGKAIAIGLCSVFAVVACSIAAHSYYPTTEPEGNVEMLSIGPYQSSALETSNVELEYESFAPIAEPNLIDFAR